MVPEETLMQVTYTLYHNKIYTSPRVGIEHLTLVYMFSLEVMS